MLTNKTDNKTFSYILKNKIDIALFMEQLEEYINLHCIKKAIFLDIRLCIEEVLINIFLHGYLQNGYKNPAADPKISVIIYKKLKTLEVNIIDNATVFNPVSAFVVADIYSNLEFRKIGGLGIHLLKKLSDGLEYIKKNNGNHLKIYKHLN